MKLHDGTEWIYKPMGSRLVGKRYVEIMIDPIEWWEYAQEAGVDKAYKYTYNLTKHYKQND